MYEHILCITNMAHKTERLRDHIISCNEVLKSSFKELLALEVYVLISRFMFYFKIFPMLQRWNWHLNAVSLYAEFRKVKFTSLGTKMGFCGRL